MARVRRTSSGGGAGLGPAAIELAQRGRLVLPARYPSTAWMKLPAAEPAAGASTVAALIAEREVSR